MTPQKVEPPSVSVIIPARNAEPWIGEQLDSLAAQDYEGSFEVVIADNASTDGTRRIADGHPIADRVPVRVVDATGPRSAAHGRNVGAAYACGTLLAFCDADDLVDLRWIHALTRPFDDAEDIVVTGALHHGRFNSADVLAAYRIGDDPAPESYAGVIAEPAGGFAGYLPTVAGGNFAIRRDHYLGLGGMDPSYPGGAEETDFAWRAQERGLRVVSAPGAIVHYRLKQDVRSLYRQQRIQQRGRMYLWTRYRRTSMRGPSLKASLRETVAGLATSPGLLWATDRERLRWAAHVGAHVGALEGMIRYRRPQSMRLPVQRD